MPRVFSGPLLPVCLWVDRMFALWHNENASHNRRIKKREPRCTFACAEELRNQMSVKRGGQDL